MCVQSISSHFLLPNLPRHPSSPVLHNMGVGLAVLEVVVGMIGALPEVTATTLMV